MDKRNIRLLVVFTWIAQITTSATDWKELDGVSSSVVKTHFVQLQDPNEMETETNFPHNFQHPGEVNYISKTIVGRDISDEKTGVVLKEHKQDENLQTAAATTTPSSDETESEEYSEEDTEKPLALGLLGTNVRFTISAEDERYTKNKHQIYDVRDKENDTYSTSIPSTTSLKTTTSKTMSQITFKSTKLVTLVTNTRSDQTTTKSHVKTTQPTRPAIVNQTTISVKTTETTVHTTSRPYTSSSTSTPKLITRSNLKTIQQPTENSGKTTTDILSTTATSVRRATIRSRLARPKMIAHFSQKTNKFLTNFATTKSPAEESSTIQLPSVNEAPTSTLSTTTLTSTPSQTEPSAVMTLLKDMAADYPLDMPPDIETFYDEKERKQSHSPAMSASTTNTIVISSIIGGCAILFFALMMIFYMWKQRKVRRRRKKPIAKLSLEKPNYNWQFGQQTYENR